MKRLFSLALLSSTFLLDITLIKADTFYGVHDRHHGTYRYLDIFSFNNSTNVKTKLGEYIYSINSASSYVNNFAPCTTSYCEKQFNAAEGKIIIYGTNAGNTNSAGKFIEFDTSDNSFSAIQDVSGENDAFSPIMTTGWASRSDLNTNSSNISSNDTDIASNSSNISSNDTDIASNSSNISSNDTDIASNSSNISSNDTDISALQSLISTKSGSTTTARIGNSTKNTLEIGPTTNPTTIDQSGISVSGGNLIKKDSNGNIHIGKNSFVIGNDVLNGAHPIWAEDENGSKIPLNIYGSDLHINGKSVQGQIDTNKSGISTNTSNIKNLGEGVASSTALTAALTALPQTSKESKLSCGVGTGAYSSKYALGFGCASKVNERVDINAGGSYVFGGSKSYGEGTLDSGVIKAGFVFKLGELNKPTEISMKAKEKMEAKIFSLEESNKEIIYINEELRQKNKSIISQNKSLLARLERLEKVALGESKAKDLATIKLP